MMHNGRSGNFLSVEQIADKLGMMGFDHDPIPNRAMAAGIAANDWEDHGDTGTTQAAAHLSTSC